MKHISILVPELAVMEAVADPRYAFSAANQFLVAAGKQPLFQIHLVGNEHEVSLHDGVFSVHADKLWKDVTKTDLIIIPALFGDMKSAIDKNRNFIPWIKKQHEQGAEVASLCVGAFLLASTGLLSGKSCSTHWAFYNEFRTMFPDVTVKDGCIITEENRIYSSGGANSYWNLLLHLVEKYTDRDTAILAAKYFAIDIDRENQSAFTIFRGQKSHTDEAIKKVQEFIEANYQEKLTLDQLAGLVAISRRSFERRFKQATSNTVTEYVQRVKIEAAKRSFESTRKNISEVMYDVGYTDTKAFRSVFKRLSGLTPIDYRNKYNKGLFREKVSR
ncbi:MAG TPA: helix-turn-helix domain-containing protein [Cyclobacteriaceae bacterium]|mgnify:CR=1 FL=1|jgi:transcriptional regulator GlxA family with amidase domain|nr:helix-turn-helix domain-containing protein [Cytophagales bacterium]HCR53394.1 AraC family transcriptional regulator [Cytophagales bacterium]HNT51634.1 helix-turn-helix domain-containing protein [Cyclobacteriaceae bacterium]HRF32710.1 helix-turn-helix domain-containing protein [Cyclobacteriaceae bacterium]